jgi:hypothetical protein
MTDRDMTRIVRTWLVADERESGDRVLDAVIDALDTTPQRRPSRWRRWLGARTRFELATAAILVAAFVAIGSIDAVGSGVGGSPETAVRISAVGDGRQDAGRYQLAPGFPVDISFDLPAGWSPCGESPLEQGVCIRLGAGNTTVIGFLALDSVASDPCDEGTLTDPQRPQSLDDIAAALSSLTGFDTTPPVATTVDGYEARRLTVTAPWAPACSDLRPWATADRANGVGATEANLLYIVDVDGVALMISAAYSPTVVAESDLASVEGVVESIDIEP